MSELKGQLLGMLLVLSIFAAIGSVLYAAFTKTADNISSQIDNITTSLAA
ncbi:MAG: hypothetical protein LKK13_00115 [Bacilli bacterium]|jgi:hypothetical protein|nr:hypothetical protein [Bacilli bacterium]